MTNLIKAIFFALILAGASFAQTVSTTPVLQNVRYDGKPRIAVLEFSTGPEAAAMGAEGTETLQNGLAADLATTGNLDIVDVSQTNSAVQSERLTLNGTGVTVASIVKVGNLLGANYVLIGYVSEFANAGGKTRMTVKTQLIDVAAGRAMWFGQVQQESVRVNKTGAGTLELTESLIKPCIQRLTASLKSADL